MSELWRNRAADYDSIFVLLLVAMHFFELNWCLACFSTCGFFIVVPLVFEFVAIRSLVVGSICYSYIGSHGPWKSRIPRLAHLKQRSWVLLYVAKWGKWPTSLWYFPILFSRAISQKFHATPFTCMTWRLPSVNGASGSSALKFILLWYPYYFYSNIVLLLLTLFCTNIAIS